MLINPVALLVELERIGRLSIAENWQRSKAITQNWQPQAQGAEVYREAIAHWQSKGT